MFRHEPTALRDDLTALHCPWVRDIAWLLHAADMAVVDRSAGAGGYAGKPTLETLGLGDDCLRRTWLAAQEPMDATFQAGLGQRGRVRLGFYHEALWQWILGHAPGTRLLGHNVALREGSQTRGELDLLFARRLPHTAALPVAIHHAELAIKFFLGLTAGPGDSREKGRWIGIGSFDSLAIKTHRLMRHQLPMGHSAPARAHLAALMSVSASKTSPPLLHQHVIMPGCLYHPWNQRLPLPDGSGEGVLQGLWCCHAEWPRLAAALPMRTRATILQKPHWLATQAEPQLTLDTLGEALGAHFARQLAPIHCRLTLPDGRSARLFVVKNAWPPMIPLTPDHLAPKRSTAADAEPNTH